MKEYKREKYNLKSYNNELYRLDYYDEKTNIENTEYSERWESLYKKAKDLAEKGKSSSLWELKYEFDA